MRKLFLNLGAIAVIGLGGAYLGQAQEPGDVTIQDCYLNGEKCSDGANCCVTNGVCYNDCGGGTTPVERM
ncbi:MAG TPA: hypothetical protein VGR37_13400 [Longimicrobiaceae bacterium]|nr:hypothetical protein [Longimicrobiaceae bacterium]